MNREIKFRAFVNTYNGKEMINDWCFLNTEDNHFHAVDITNERPDIAEVYAVMQYTGLKDKNGLEIYEGDIVIPDGYNDSVKYGVVVFSENRAGWDILLNNETEMSIDKYDHFYGEDFEKCEIVGNIYEDFNN